MKYYSYVVTRDYGFAPNPFGKYCTLATCKPIIRLKANPGDWIIGITPKRMENRLLYAMQVTTKLTFNEYWNSNEYQYKKPVMNGSLKQMYGDNIYFFNESTGDWYQADSHHSLENGAINNDNLLKDTGGKFVLISENFYYFGSKNIILPKKLKKGILVTRGHHIVDVKTGNELVKLLVSRYKVGYHGDPIFFSKFKRYDGKS